MRWCRAIRAAAALLVAAIAAQASTPPTLDGWHACSMDVSATSSSSSSAAATGVSAECTMPLCYGDVCTDSEDRTVDVFVKRIPAASNSSTRNFWFFPDHPFAMSVEEAETQMVLLHQQLLGDVNVYRMDQRGTGRSTRFDCDASQATAPKSTQGVAVAPSEAASCADALQKTFGDHFAAAFSLTSAARDVVTFVSNFQAKTKVFFYGTGFGTLLVERAMHFPSDEIIGFVLDSTATTSGIKKKEFPYRSRADKDFGVAAKAFLALCDSDLACAARFGGEELGKITETVLQQVDDASCPIIASLLQNSTNPLATRTAEPPSYALRRLLAVMMQDLTLRPFVPVVVHRLQRCNASDVDVLEAFVTMMQAQASEQWSALAGADGSAAAMLVFDLIQFSEMWETPPPSENELVSRFTDTLMSEGVAYGDLERYCAFTQDATNACNAYTAAKSSLPLSYDRDANWNVATTIKEQTSVLLLSSRFDGATPLDYAQKLFDALIGDSKQVLVFESAAHNVLTSTPLLTSDEDRSLDDTPYCTRNILASFVDNDGDLNGFDKSCMDQLPKNVSLNISSALSLQVLGVEDAYDGVLPRPSSSSGRSSGNSGDNPTVTLPSHSSEGTGSSNASSLARSRDRYKTAFIVCLVLAILLLLVVIFLGYRLYKKRLLEAEEEQLRKLRGDESDDTEFLRELYNPSPSEWFNYRSNRVHL